MPENPASYRVVRTKSYLFNKADYHLKPGLYRPKVHLILLRLLLAFS
ncbi:transcriptional regulator LeuO, partial [Klebsiella quasipneumoniae]|nr:transcriptional regulator LeuO [Klebsiella quasipneumoniae]MBM5564633.1 transcriptional regulator LeuO [Klebsiella quasipneumoniae]